MRRAAKTDANQNAIVKALRRLGCSVQSIATVGKGCPDLLIGYHGHNYLVELKNDALKPSAQQLTPLETQWIDQWRGQVAVANSLDAILAILNAYHRRS